MTAEVRAGFTRLYRVEPTARMRNSDWLQNALLASGHTEAEGRWFVVDPSMLDWYRKDVAGTTRTVFVDLPTVELEKYRVSNSTEQIGRRPVRSFSRDPENEFFLPREMAAQREELSNDLLPQMREKEAGRDDFER